MVTHIKISNYRSLRNKPHGWDRPDGMVLVVVMIVATLLLVAMTAVLPSVYQEGQREREEEVIFRGYQYARAVALFHRKFNRFPISTKELLQTNGIRFLRKEYSDPMDPKGKWRFIHANAAGVLMDSVNQRSPSQSNPAGIGVNNPSSPGSMSGGGFSLGGSNPNSPSGGFSLGNSNSLGLQESSSGLGMTQPAGGSDQIGPTSSFFGNQNQIQGAYIVGVAPTSKHESIRIWNKYHRYYQWEFIGLDMGVFGIQVGMTSSGAGGVGQQTPNPGPGASSGGFSLNPSPPNVGPSQN